jgi:dephospho-CoA kinase
MIKIAVTGGIASGKSFLGEILRGYGYKVIDTDIISRELTEKGGKGLKNIVNIFGGGILNGDGGLDRKKLAQIVFNDKKTLEKLNSALHPLIIEELNTRINLIKDQKYVFVLVPLLFELNLQESFDKVWLVLADKEIRIKRAAERDNVPSAHIEAVINNQINHADYIRFAHNVLYNNSDREFRAQIEEALKTLQ